MLEASAVSISDDYSILIGFQGNQAAATELGFFWAVSEAKLIEISCVLEGSNTLTPTLEAPKSTESAPSDEDTRTQPRKSVFARIGSQINN